MVKNIERIAKEIQTLVSEHSESFLLDEKMMDELIWRIVELEDINRVSSVGAINIRVKDMINNVAKLIDPKE